MLIQNQEKIKKEKRAYVMSILFLSFWLLITFAFAKTAENQFLIYRILEKNGLYDSINSTPYVLICLGIIVIAALRFGSLYGRAQNYSKKNKIVRFLPLILIVITLIGHVGFKSAHILVLSNQTGLDAVIDRDRVHNNIKASGEEEGNDSEYGYNFDFLNCSRETQDFYIKFVEIENPKNEYILKNEDGTPMKVTLEPLQVKTFFAAIDRINPEYKHASEDEIPKFLKVIYNERESKTLYTYFRITER
ncbi:hypothetical protein I5677_13280 [Mobilitalea sibirica]|uniref:Uncharacterized protein n=1 Tax=Mobilitalea sibirica TaxID=1462919 RepID=A0A8J7HEB8_9FIRM|nr:hypothetical protein [Mobilitalea sibirica]MBH1941869.1 hypothetical protein [Mobilitalea sibirica]